MAQIEHGTPTTHPTVSASQGREVGRRGRSTCLWPYERTAIVFTTAATKLKASALVFSMLGVSYVLNDGPANAAGVAPARKQQPPQQRCSTARLALASRSAAGNGGRR